MSSQNQQSDEILIENIIDKLKAALELKSDTEVAKALESDPRLLGTWKKRGTIPYEKIIKLCIRNNINLQWMFSDDGSLPTICRDIGLVSEADGYTKVPRFEVKASAGGGAIIHSEQIVDHLYFKTEWVKNVLGIPRDFLALISVQGDSMEPTLSNGDLILVDTRASRVEDGAIYVVQYDDALLVKRLQKKYDGSVVIRSDNTLYEPEILHGEEAINLKIVGRVVWAGGVI
ncbi:XRE family transcriptional regulator [Geobacter sulfurreducens subsp. ethanolicus]|uniref:LexA family transcriptional regulator n=1 Tax=Geobacter sulfurreducens TaxID=35554 RepID=UPI0025739634|nr:S24 family peptidase [Geobacter sulfurreducens]BEH08844.1 XRE family transcriptional regulator [Geobacter sulfurreducens subsp. ethanolicus]